LNQDCKGFDLNQKLEKGKKRKEENKNRNGPGEPFGPEQKRAHGPPGVKTRIGTPSPFSH
jgi:hypothetical protein